MTAVGRKFEHPKLDRKKMTFLTSLFIIFFTISGYILKVALFPFSIIVAFISDASSKLIIDGQTLAMMRSMSLASTSTM
jgi:hypothetical protein